MCVLYLFFEYQLVYLFGHFGMSLNIVQQTPSIHQKVHLFYIGFITFMFMIQTFY